MHIDRRVDRRNASFHLLAQVGERADADLLPRTEQPVFGFEDREADVQPAVVQQGAEFAFRFLIDLLFHIGDLSRKGSPQGPVSQAAAGAEQRCRGIGIPRADACQLHDFGRRGDRVAGLIAQPDQHIVKPQPRLVQRQPRLMQLKGIVARVDAGDRLPGAYAGTVLRSYRRDGSRNLEGERAALRGSQPSVADQLPHEVAPLQRIHRDFVAFDAVLHAILCRIRLFVLRFAAARKEHRTKQIGVVLFHGKGYSSMRRSNSAPISVWEMKS